MALSDMLMDWQPFPTALRGSTPSAESCKESWQDFFLLDISTDEAPRIPDISRSGMQPLELHAGDQLDQLTGMQALEVLPTPEELAPFCLSQHPAWDLFAPQHELGIAAAQPAASELQALIQLQAGDIMPPVQDAQASAAIGQAAEAQGAPSELPFADKDFMRMLSDILGEDEDAERDAALPADVQRALTRQGISAAELYCAQAAGLAAGGAPAPAARAPLAVSGGVRRKGRPRSPQTKVQAMQSRIKAFLRHLGSSPEVLIRWAFGDDRTISKALRNMLQRETRPADAPLPEVARQGNGGKGNPFVYHLL